MKFSQPSITQAEIDAVANAVRDGHLATGVLTEKFEQEFCAMFDFPGAVAVNSGTTALMLALMALKVGAGDEVIVTAYSIAATVNAILAMGAIPVFCDVERQTYNMDPAQIDALITPRTKAILPASIFGVPCDVEAMAIHGIPILEDSIEALGAKRGNQFVGADVDVATFGFYPNKQMTTAQGGMVVSSHPEVLQMAKALRQHGYGPGGDLWNQGFGWNVRLPDPLAALGRAQLRRFQDIQGMMNSVARLLDMWLGEYRKQVVPTGFNRTWFVYVVELPEGVEKGRFCKRMEELGVPVRPYFNALHRSPHVAQWYRACPVADHIGKRTVALPMHWAMTPTEIDKVARTFLKVIEL